MLIARPKRQTLALPLALALLAVLSFHVASCTTGYIDKTCDDLYADGIYLRGNCTNRAGKKVDSAVNLAACIANLGGELVWAEKGDFSASCLGTLLNTYFSPPVLESVCMVGSEGGNDILSIPLTQVANINGELVCWA